MYKLTESYKCDKCNRSIKLIRNKTGLNLVQRCTITKNCNGILFPILNPEEAQKTKFRPDSVPELTNWLQQPLLYNHVQTISSSVWNVQHNLLTFPYVDVLVNRLDGNGNVIQIEMPPSEYDVQIINNRSLEITFANKESGLVQCVAQTGENTINPEISIASTTVSSDIQITNDSTLTIATLSSSPLISFNITYRTNNTDVIVQYINVDNQPSVVSPWVNTNRVFIDGKTFTVRSFNFTTHPLFTNLFIQRIITNGAQLYFGLSLEPKQNYILLANSPFASVDKNQNQVIDIGTISTNQPELYYNNGNLFATASIVKTIYPPVYII